MAECGETLAIGISFATEVKFRLVAETDEKVRCGRVGGITSHGDRAVLMMQARDASALKRDWRQAVFCMGSVDGCLNHFNLYRFVRLVLHGDGALKSTSIVGAAGD